MDELEVQEIINCCALRFDGYSYLDAAHEENELPRDNGFQELSHPIVQNRKLYADEHKNAAVFFALQRFLCKWGGEQLEDTSPERIAFNLLYLHLYKKETPERFRHKGYEQAWCHISEQERDDVAAQIEAKLSNLGIRP